MRRRCVLHGVKGECWGPMDWHHIVKRRHYRDWLRHLRALAPFVRAQRGLPDPDALPSRERAIADPRGVVRVCRRHHDWLENNRVKLARVDLPGEAFQYAAELGMEWYMDKHYGEEKVA